MARVKHAVSSKRRHRKTIKQAKGAWGKRSKVYRRAKETVYRGMAYATRDRKQRKRDFRQLWVTRIRAGCEAAGMQYSRFIAGLKAANVGLDRKVLADLAVNDAGAFEELVQVARGGAPKPAAA
ncbi:MAG: 50S ribosomal protein L20 [Candidatus Omnitrophica bacterium]|nr:50S ribosomal protein L20 [Candidatus Omnitrophota bacterium]